MNSWLIVAGGSSHRSKTAYNGGYRRKRNLSRADNPKVCALRTREMGSSQRRTLARFTLGILQMAGAIFSVTLIFQSGLSGLSLACVVITSFLTTVSVLLFGSRPENRN